MGMRTITEKKIKLSRVLSRTTTARTPFGGSSTIALLNSPSLSNSRISSMNRTDLKSSRMIRCAKNRSRCISNGWILNRRSRSNRRINRKQWLEEPPRVWGQVRGPNSWMLQGQPLQKGLHFSCRKRWPRSWHRMNRRWKSCVSIVSACARNSRKTKKTSRRFRISLNTSRFVICYAQKTWIATMSQLRRRNSCITCTPFRAR